jgi:hypothetical protein
MVIFYPFSSPPKVDSGGFEKRDSTADSVLPATGFLAAGATGNGAPTWTC